MTDNQISITRALKELKGLDDRIRRAVSQLQVVAVVKGNRTDTIQGESIEEFGKRAKEKYQSVVDLLKRRDSIKKSIILSNATTEVVVVGKKMTVAEAIEKKNSLVYYEGLISTLKAQFGNNQEVAESRNYQEQQKLDALLTALVGKDKSKWDSEEAKSLVTKYEKDNMHKIFDPIKAREIYEKLSEEIQQFREDIDIVLTEKNSVTMITV